MATETDGRTLGNLEGRIAELSALLHQLHADLTSGLQQVNGRIDQANGRIDRLLVALIAIGGGLIAALVGVIATLAVLVVRGG
jgi:hypothetical protein